MVSEQSSRRSWHHTLTAALLIVAALLALSLAVMTSQVH